MVVARATGEPLLGVQVRGPSRGEVARTDAEGRFRIPFEAGTYALLADGYRRLGFELDELHATPASAARFELDRVARLEVAIYDERGGRLPGARVVLRAADVAASAPSPLAGLVEEEWSGLTDRTGVCRFSDLPADRALRATIHADERLLREIRWPLVIGPQDRLSVGWIVDRGRDRLGRLYGPEGEPLAGVRLWLLANDDGPFERRRPRHLSADDHDTPLRELVTDAEGRFELPDLQHGWYRIGPAPGGEHVPLAVALEHDLRDEPRRVRLSAVCGATISGIVRGSDGEGLAHALVFAEEVGVAGVLSARCDEHGRFELQAAPEAELRLLARDDRFGFETRIFELEAGARELALDFD
ncbi:MAG: carboxypeptidase regulatory-like domain-containing protein [Planctomycetes bacterium]|nr:carboxypeptidase regulatory-like domain-containing protein [Planctomycetota bacterium]